MKTLLILLISFQSFAQDTIQPPCDLNRQQTRLWYKAIEDANKLEETRLKLLDDQHERENTKEIKSLKYGLRTERVNRRTERDRYEYQIDSLKRSNSLELKTERLRYRIISDSLDIVKRSNRSNERILKRQISENKAKNRTVQYLIWVIGALVFLFLLIVYKVRKKA